MANIQELILFWSSYRTKMGWSLGMEEWEKVNDTIIALMDLGTLRAIGEGDAR